MKLLGHKDRMCCGLLCFYFLLKCDCNQCIENRKHRAYNPDEMSKKRKLQKYIEKMSRRYRSRKDVCDRSNVRLSVPFNMCCRTCSEKIPIGRKFHATKATSLYENYLGVEVYVFEFKCPGCKSTISFKTDPKSGVYLEDVNCRQICNERVESVRIIENGEQSINYDQAREQELLKIRRFIEYGKSLDMDELKEKLKRRFNE
eukprot:jgi/Antlo1/2049/635